MKDEYSIAAMDYEYWVSFAEGDWQTVMNELNASIKVWTSVAFHCHACVEKYLKAFLVFKGTRADRTHDLNMLLREAVRYDQSLVQLQDDCESLSDLSIDSRYPDTLSKYSEEFAREAYTVAQRIRSMLIERL